MFNNLGKNVSKLELKHSLLDTLKKNNNALDYIQNRIYDTENKLGVSPDDVILKSDLETEKYIQFSLRYLDKMYRDSLKKIGVRV